MFPHWNWAYFVAGMIDEEGYVHIMSRSDDIINVAAHRLSTGHHLI